MQVLILANGQPVRIQGYALIWNSWTNSENGGRECFIRGSFRNCLERGDRNITANWEHDDAFKFAETGDRTLRLFEDATGLGFSATVAAAPFGASLCDYIAKEDAGASVHFMKLNSRQTKDGIEITAAQALDVCVTYHPAGPTACWLAHADPATLSPRAGELRRHWKAGHDAYWTNWLGQVRQRYSSTPSQSRAQLAPSQIRREDWCIPPDGFSQEEWEDFGRSCAHGARGMR